MMRQSERDAKEIELSLSQIESVLSQISKTPTEKQGHKYAFQIDDILNKLTKKMTPYQWFEQLLDLGDFFMKGKMYNIALKHYFERVIHERSLIDHDFEGPEWVLIDLACSVSSTLCQIYILLANDPQLSHKHSVERVMNMIVSIQKSVSDTLNREEYTLYYDVIINALVHLFLLAKILRDGGFFKEAVVVYSYCAFCFELIGAVEFEPTNFLILVNCYVDLLFCHDYLGNSTAVKKILAASKQRVETLEPSPDNSHLLEQLDLFDIKYSVFVTDSEQDQKQKKTKGGSDLTQAIVAYTLPIGVKVKGLLFCIEDPGRSYFLHDKLQALDPLISNKIRGVFETIMELIDPYLKLYKHVHGIGKQEISANMFSLEKAKSSAKKQKNKEEEVFDVDAIFQERRKEITTEHLFAILKSSVLYDQQSVFTDLSELLQVAESANESMMIQIQLINTLQQIESAPLAEKYPIIQQFSGYVQKLESYTTDFEDSFVSDLCSKYFYLYKLSADVLPEDSSMLLQPIFNILTSIKCKDICLLAEISIQLGLYYELSNDFENALRSFSECHSHVCAHRCVLAMNRPQQFSLTTRESNQQTLYCIQTELITHITRIEIRIGISKKQELRIATLKQSKLSRTKTPKTPSPSEENFEERLIHLAGSSKYELGLLYMIFSCVRSRTDEKVAALKQSVKLLEEVDALEDSLMKQTSRTKTGFSIEMLRRTMQDLVLQVENPEQEETEFLVYAKAKKQGVKVLASDHHIQGTGVHAINSQPFSLRELTPNTEYLVGVHYVDQRGLTAGSIIQFKDSFSTVWPLPTQLCWCYLALASHFNNCIDLAQVAANKVLKSIVVSKEEKVIWEQNPIELLDVDLIKLRETIPAILLYEFMRVVTILADAELEVELPINEDCDPRFNIDLYAQQLNRLKICNKYFLVLKMAEDVGDYRIVAQGIGNIWNCLTPLLNRRGKCHLLSSSLSLLLTYIGQLPAYLLASRQLQKLCANILFASSTSASQLNQPDKQHQCVTTFSELITKIHEAKVSVSQEFEQLTNYFFFLSEISCLTLSNSTAKPYFEEIYLKICPLSFINPGQALDQVKSSYSQHKFAMLFSCMISQELIKRRDASKLVVFDTISSDTDQILYKLKIDVMHTVTGLQTLIQDAVSRQESIPVDFDYLLTYPCVFDQLLEKLMLDAVTPPTIESNTTEQAPTSPRVATPSSKQAPKAASKKQKPVKPTAKASAKKLQPSKSAKDLTIKNAEPLSTDDLFQKLNNLCKIAGATQLWRQLYYSCQIMYDTVHIVFIHSIQNLDIIRHSYCFKEAASAIISMLTYASTQAIDTALFSGVDTSSSIQEIQQNGIIKDTWPTSCAQSDPMVIDIPWIHNLADLNLSFLAKMMSLCLRVLFCDKKMDDVISLGTSFNKITNNTFGDIILLPVIKAQNALQLNTRATSSQYQRFKRDESKSLAQLKECRVLLGNFVLQRFYPCPTVHTSDLLESYRQTCVSLRQKYEMSLLIQGLNELGDIYQLDKQYNKAAEVWSDATDSAFETLNIIDNSLQKIPNISLLRKAGLHRFLLSLITASKIAENRLLSGDLQACTRACVFVCDMANSLFQTSIEYPQRFCDFKDYTVLELFPEIFGDNFRCNGTQLMKALQFVCHFLSENYPLRSLSTCTLYEYLATKLCANMNCAADARILKARTLLKIGYIKEASDIIVSLFVGRDLPDVPSNLLGFNSHPLVKEKLKNYTAFLDINDLDSSENIAYFSSVNAFDPLDKQVDQLYPRDIVIRLLILKAELMLAIASYDPSKCLITDLKQIPRSSTARKSEKTKKKVTSSIVTSDKPIISQKALEISVGLLDICLDVEGLQFDQQCECYYLIGLALYMRGDFQKAEVTITNCLTDIDTAEAPTRLEISFKLYALLVTIKIEQEQYAMAIAICQDGLKLTSAVKEETLSRYFRFYIAKCLLGLGDIKKAKAQLLSLVTENQKYVYEQSEVNIHAMCLIELAFVEKYEMITDLTQNWILLLKADPETECEKLFKQADLFLEKYLYDNGMLLNSEQPMSKYLRRRELLLLIRVKSEIGILQLLRGEVNSGKEYLKKATSLATRCTNPPGNLIAQANYYLGRAHGQMINTPMSVEEQWGWRSRDPLEITELSLQSPKVDLTFLPAVVCQLVAIEKSFVYGYHDYLLMRNCLMELVYLYGCKLVNDEEASGPQAAIAVHYLHAAGTISNMRKKLHKELLVSTKKESLKKLPPVFAVEGIVRSFTEQNKLQKLFTTRLSQTAMKAKSATPSTTSTKEPQIDLSSSTVPVNIVSYYLDLLRQLEVTSCNFADRIEDKIVLLHKYLVEEYGPYAADCVIAGVPNGKKLINFPFSMILTQFYAVDDGHTPVFKPDSSARKQIRPDPAQLDKLPLISLFYALTKTDTAGIPHKSEKQQQKSSGSKLQLPQTSSMPHHAMMSFEQVKLQVVHEKIKEVVYLMSQTQKPVNPQVQPQQQETKKNTKNAPVQPVIQLSEPQVSPELEQKKIDMLESLMNLLRCPVSPKAIHRTVPVSELLEFVESMADVSQLMDLFDVFNGGALVYNDRLSKLFHKILSLD